MHRKYKLGEKLFVSVNNFSSKQPRKKLTNVGPRHKPIVTPSICLYSLSLYMNNGNSWQLKAYSCTRTNYIIDSHHKDIKFTLEKNTNCDNLPFLDVQITVSDNGYDTCIWSKPTDPGLLINFNA